MIIVVHCQRDAQWHDWAYGMGKNLEGEDKRALLKRPERTRSLLC